MNERERLIELLKKAKKYATSTMAHIHIDEAIDASYDDLQADYLLENGAVVLPCKVHDTIYIADENSNEFDGMTDVKSIVGGDWETMAIKLAVEALEKQIPKRLPVVEELYHCPHCGEKDAVLRGDNYCFNCGQALDWSDEK